VFDRDLFEDMLWKTHTRICYEALRRLGITLSDEVDESFREGIVQPDKDRGPFDSHHHGKSAEIEDNLIRARGYFLQNDLPYAFFHLGVALHYIQDSYTSVISYDSPNNQMWHQNYEQSIEDSQFVYDLENTIQFFFRNDYAQLNRYSQLAKILAGKVEGKNATLRAATLVGEYPSNQTGKPKIDLNMALKASLVVTESVLSSKTCPTIEAQLKDILAQHDAFLRNAEIESSDKIINLIEEREQLANKRVPRTGIVSKIKNWIIGVRIGLKDRAATSKYNDFVNRKHLENVANDYRTATAKIVTPYMGWYNYQIPQINIGIVKRDLLSIQEIAEYFGVTEYLVKELLKNGNMPIYNLVNKELIRRPQLDRILSQSPLNGFKEYPA
jgi:hypothetical protein